MAKRGLSRAALARIVKFLDGHDQRVFSQKQLYKLLAQHREAWRLPQSLTSTSFLNALLEHTQMARLEFTFPSRTDVRYVWGDVPLLQVVYSLRPKAYFTHYSAVYLHGLTQQVPTSIYLNSEQTPKPRGSELAQSSIDLAFSRRPRITKNKAVLGDATVYLLNGKHTGRLGVVRARSPEAAGCEVANVERTLIDIAVRPWYAGGVFAILEAYRAAGRLASINSLAAILKQLDYVYPYHQAIGFYLERSGVYDPAMVALLRELPMEYDFYLVPQIKERAYSEKWRLFYPQGL